MALRILIVLLILAVPLELPGCGPYLPEALFYLKSAPEAPKDFARGELGILQPTYERAYQVIAYRYLSGVRLTDPEQEKVLPDDTQAGLAEPAKSWLAARNKVPGVQPLERIDAYKQLHINGLFSLFLNCNQDAFDTAVSTLQRIQKTGPAADWLAAQDVVFEDCSTGADIPQPTSDPRLRADRAYQIAAAQFYSEQFDAARKDFQAIAGDASSPWHGIAPYLAARCLIRAGKYAEAQTELARIAADPALERWHASAKGLMGFVRARQNPPARMHELALALVKPDPQAGQDLIDYRALFDLNVKPDQPDVLTDWIASYQAGGRGALENWRARHTLPWLVGALKFAGPKDSSLPELLTAAAAVPPDSPAYLTLAYDRIRLSPPGAARALAEQLLAGNLPLAGQNEIRAERMALASSFDEFLRYAPRRPVAEIFDVLQNFDSKDDYLDQDSVDIFNLLPLEELKKAQASTALPAHVRDELQHVIFVRTQLLSDAPPFDNVFTLLHSPGMELYVKSGFGRNTKEVGKIDDYGDNWWCSADLPSAPFYRVEIPGPTVAGLPFLTAAEQKVTAHEALKFRGAGTAPDWLGAQTVVFANLHPQDPRVPEALALVVRATRFGCTDDKTGQFSKAAFDLLHRRYPNSEWTKKTPFWFK